MPEVVRREPLIDRLLDCIEDLVRQFAIAAPGEPALLDSMAIDALSEAMRILAAAGRLEIKAEHGRRVIALKKHLTSSQTQPRLKH